MVGNVCLAKVNQRLLITNYCSLGAASSFLLRSRSKPIFHIRGTHFRSILRTRCIPGDGEVGGGDLLTIYDEVRNFCLAKRSINEIWNESGKFSEIL